MLGHIRGSLRDDYCQPHANPWSVGFSGGKDSTIVAHLVFEMLLGLPRSERIRPVHLVSNDTLVESPLVMAHMVKAQTSIAAAASAWRLPIEVVTMRPDSDATFWVNLLGRGYSSNRSSRWSTDRMKIQSTSR